MKTPSFLVAAVVLIAAGSVAMGEGVVPQPVTLEGDAPKWGSCSMATNSGQAYMLCGTKLWLLKDGKGQLVKKADGTEFALQAMMGSGTGFANADGGLLVPGPHGVTEGREAFSPAIWVVRDTVAKPVVTAQGDPVIAQRFEGSYGENNPVFRCYGDKPTMWQLSADEATLLEVPKEVLGGVCVVVDGKPLIRSGLSGTDLWILEKSKWVRVTDKSGAPLNVQTGTSMGAPQGAVVGTGAHVGIADPGTGGGKFQFRVFHIKGTTAEPLNLPADVTVQLMLPMGKTAVLKVKDAKQSYLLGLDNGRTSPLKGAPKGDPTIQVSGELGLSSVQDEKGETRYYRMDDKGSKEIKLPKDLVKARLSIAANSGKTLYVRAIIPGATSQVLHIDEKGAVSTVQPSNPLPVDAGFFGAADGVYIKSMRGDEAPMFVPAK